MKASVLTSVLLLALGLAACTHSAASAPTSAPTPYPLSNGAMPLPALPGSSGLQAAYLPTSP
ncbi:hypothetical protein [Deinococcus sp.]|uniref:hypothetical protein n=1 Tax=Deinococcus sp. TaxID=47478 RepID=UPI003CC5F243